MKVLVAGWFSFPEMGATAGDLLTRDVVSQWLETAGRSYDVALAAPFDGGVPWMEVDPGRLLRRDLRLRSLRQRMADSRVHRTVRRKTTDWRKSFHARPARRVESVRCAAGER